MQGSAASESYRSILATLPLTQIPDVKRKTLLTANPEQLEMICKLMRSILNTTDHFNIRFVNLSHFTVTHLQDCLALVEKRNEEGDSSDPDNILKGYREKALDAFFHGNALDQNEETLIAMRMRVLWALQAGADEEAKYNTRIDLAQPSSLLDTQKLVFNRERHLQYVTEKEKTPELRKKSMEELKNLDNRTVIARYIEACLNRLRYAIQYPYSPDSPATYSPHQASWEHWALEMLETGVDSRGTELADEETVDIRLCYHFTQVAFLAASLLITFLKDSEDELERWQKKPASLEFKDLKSECDKLQAFIEKKGARQGFTAAVAFQGATWSQFYQKWKLLHAALGELKTVVQAKKSWVGSTLPKGIKLALPDSPKKRGGTPPSSPTASLADRVETMVAVPVATASAGSPRSFMSPRHNLYLAQNGVSSPSPRPRATTGTLPQEPSPSPGSARPRFATGINHTVLGDSPAAAAISSPMPIPGASARRAEAIARGSDHAAAAPASPLLQTSFSTGTAAAASPRLQSSNSTGNAAGQPLVPRLQRVPSVRNLPETLKPKTANTLLSELFTAIGLQMALMEKVETFFKDTVLSWEKTAQPSDEPVAPNPPSQPLVLFDLDASHAKEYAAYLRDLMHFVTLLSSSLCESFDPRRPIRFLEDYYADLKQKQEGDDSAILENLRKLKEEFFKQNATLNREKLLDAWAYRALVFQRDYFKDIKGRRTLQLLEKI